MQCARHPLRNAPTTLPQLHTAYYHRTNDHIPIVLVFLIFLITLSSHSPSISSTLPTIPYQSRATMTPVAFLVSTPLLPARNVGVSQCIRPRITVRPTPRRTSRSVSSQPPSASLITPPPAMYESAVTLGAAKSRAPAWKVLLMGIVAGAYIALGALLALCVGGALPAIKVADPGLQKLIFGLVGLPTGLSLVCLTGAELFTGNTALISAAVFSKRASVGGMLSNWFFSYLGNLAGSLLVVWLAVSGCTVTGASAASAVAIASGKAAAPFATAFFRGVLCNWLVCLAVYMQAGASDLGGKVMAILLPISAFVAMGFDHSVANMFLIPMGMKLGAAVTVKQFLMSLIPVTLGNVVAGVVLVGLVYSLAFAKAKTG